jgi:ferredoxin-NADP reductase
MAVVRYLTGRGWAGEMFFIFCCRTPADFVFGEELRYLARRHPNLHLTVTMTRTADGEWSGPRGRIGKELITKGVPDIARRRVHVCGPNEMMDSTRTALLELGVPAGQIKMEAFGPAKKKEAVTPTARAAAAATVTFSLAGKSAPLPPGETILEVADAAGVWIDNSCRVGTCGTCKVKLLSGNVTMEVQDGLEPEDEAQGFILACQAKSAGNVAVEA